MKLARNLFFMLMLFFSTSYGTIHTVNVSGFTFSPNTMTIVSGDTVIFATGGGHNASEVSEPTWNSNGTTHLNGGFQVPFGGGSAVLTLVGTHFYVCQAHASMGMKAQIEVIPAPPPHTISNSGSAF